MLNESKIEKFLKIIFYKILRLKISEDNWEKLFEFIKFGIVGLSNVIVSYVIYIIALTIFQKCRLFLSIDYLIAQIISFMLSVLWSFYWNRKYVFEADKESIPWQQVSLKAYVSYAFTGLFLNSILSILWVEIMKLPKMIAPLINLVINVPINFLLNKFWTFKDRK